MSGFLSYYQSLSIILLECQKTETNYEYILSDFVLFFVVCDFPYFNVSFS